MSESRERHLSFEEILAIVGKGKDENDQHIDAAQFIANHPELKAHLDKCSDCLSDAFDASLPIGRGPKNKNKNGDNKQ